MAERTPYWKHCKPGHVMRESGSPEIEVASLEKSAAREWRQNAGCEEVARAAVTDTSIDFITGVRYSFQFTIHV
jgi:hypothetical protein